jgi:hypothetical protein
MLEKQPLGPALEVGLELHHPERATGALVGDWNQATPLAFVDRHLRHHETPVLAATMARMVAN